MRALALPACATAGLEERRPEPTHLQFLWPALAHARRHGGRAVRPRHAGRCCRADAQYVLPFVPTLHSSSTPSRCTCRTAGNQSAAFRFHTLSGELVVSRQQGGAFQMAFPAASSSAEAMPNGLASSICQAGPAGSSLLGPHAGPHAAIVCRPCCPTCTASPAAHMRPGSRCWCARSHTPLPLAN